MNFVKWRTANLERLGLKLAEESGETVQAILNYIEDLGDDAKTVTMMISEGREEYMKLLKRIIEEADHARFIAGEIKKRADDLLVALDRPEEIC